jgi:serine/threonine-protein kinase
MPDRTLVSKQSIQVVGRYALYDTIGSGGMASVHLALLLGPVGFTRTVAIKRLHPQFAADPEFVSMFLDEARLAARIRHPNVVQTLDVVASDGGLYVVMELVQGETLSRLIRAARAKGETIPPRIVGAIMAGALYGLHAAHETRGARGESLGLVHRDISPQNVLVGVDGLARVLDFGVAKAIGRLQHTQTGQLKGKLAYMAPEQLLGKTSRAADIYAASVVLWEALTGTRLFDGEDQATVLSKLMARVIQPPSQLTTGLSKEIDAVVMRGLAADPAERFSTASEMAAALEKTLGVIAPSEVGQWVEAFASDTFHNRLRRVAEIESADVDSISTFSLSPDLAPTPRPRYAVTAGLDLLEQESADREIAEALRRSRRQRLLTGVATTAFLVGLLGTVGGTIIHGHVAATQASDPAATTSGTQATERMPARGMDSATPSDTVQPASRPAAGPTAFPQRAALLVVGSAPSATGTAKPEPDVPRHPPARVPPPPRARALGPQDRSHASSPPIAAAPDCATPYTIDPEGIRHPRSECL